jgi:hypothetical protein
MSLEAIAAELGDGRASRTMTHQYEALLINPLQ